MDNIYEDPIWWRRNVKVGDWVKIKRKSQSRGDYPILLFEIKAMHPHGVEPSYFVIENNITHESVYAHEVGEVIEIRRTQLEYVEAKIDPNAQYKERLKDNDKE